MAGHTRIGDTSSLPKPLLALPCRVENNSVPTTTKNGMRRQWDVHLRWLVDVITQRQCPSERHRMQESLAGLE